MYYNTLQTVFTRMNEIQLAMYRKEVVVVASDRESAQVVADNIVQNILDEDHIQTGRMLDSISVQPIGGGQYGVKSTEYAKYVNNISGFIDNAVDESLREGYWAITIV